MTFNFSRRGALSLLIAGTASLAIAPAARALTTDEASTLVTRLMGDIQSSVNSGKTGSALYRDFERIFNRYADVPIIARYVLGIDWRSASSAQQRAFIDTFTGYIARKYGKRFQDFRGADVTVLGTRQIKAGHEVQTKMVTSSNSYAVNFHVSGKSGSNRFFNLYIEGVSMLTAERTEIGAMLDKRGRNIDQLIADLKNAG